jgi:chromate transporter
VAWLRLLVPVWNTLNLASLILTTGALVAMLRFKVGMIPTLATTATLGVVYVYALA